MTHFGIRLLTHEAHEKLDKEAARSAQAVQTYLTHLQGELDFLSRLDVMDDLLADDIDGRIASLLEVRAKGLGEGIGFGLYRADGTRLFAIPTHSPAPDHIEAIATKPLTLTPSHLFLVKPLQATFDSNIAIGWLVMTLPRRALLQALQTPPDHSAWLTSPEGETIGPAIDDPKAYLSTTRTLREPLQGWRLQDALPKKVAFATLHGIQKALVATFFVLVLAILVLAFAIDRITVYPLQRLNATMKRIVQRRRFDADMPPFHQDEIGELAQQFSTLMAYTRNAFDTLETQKRAHQSTLEALMHLMEAIAQESQISNSLEKARQSLQSVTHANRASLLTEAADCPGLWLPIATSHSDYGGICLENPTSRFVQTERFYAACSRLISLHIERLELLQTKSAFFAGFSHELRTPLGSILSIAQYLLTARRCDEKGQEGLARIEQAAHSLQRLIDDILLLAKADAKRLEPNLQSCDLVAIVTESLELLEPIAEAKGLTITSRLPHRYPTVTDPKLFHILLGNLLSNAIKYSDKGTITLTLQDGVLTIEDEGRGIAKEALGRVFDPFYREYRNQGNESGSGIGLAIAKTVAEALEIGLRIESEGEGRGTKATLLMPCESHTQSLSPSR
ncbi:ATP-binding protein [Hydrogenimonas sp.]